MLCDIESKSEGGLKYMRPGVKRARYAAVWMKPRTL